VKHRRANYGVGVVLESDSYWTRVEFPGLRGSGYYTNHLELSSVDTQPAVSRQALPESEKGPEEASILAIRALASDVENWARNAADTDGRVGVNDLIRVLDKIRFYDPVTTHTSER
jgi:hypothetical protein